MAAPLGTFGSRISAAYALGLTSKTERDVLRRINKVRNEFAHSLQGTTFARPIINEKCSELESATKLLSYEPDDVQVTLGKGSRILWLASQQQQNDGQIEQERGGALLPKISRFSQIMPSRTQNR
jgi:hypothetical protein